ncbi:hypothetical protein NC661_12630 [Aquibacillus koreensis]|uniref:Thioredoxin-like fold domain-containing protein n=1 Tax=Aquibacillus koreensis TaxID=279446 RepID=A0A9X3WK32_9BACI|nr:hypothetical protein [Aquibacillus koreensis]MCT2537749.1 hypothetical protein [Aquibacillus koreensis]MDC3421217.1 hypothetical protein [Aquibacillus koreensis]
MKRKSIFTFSLILVTLFISIVLIGSVTKPITIQSLKQIPFQDTYNQPENAYIVYFWQSDCKYCTEIEDDVLAFVKKSSTPVYLVDMKEQANSEAWYDWEQHHQQYDVIVGEIVEGEEVIYEEVDLNSYAEDPEVHWTFLTNDSNQIIASHNTAFANDAPQQFNEIEVTGTPTMIKVTNHTFDQYVVGVEEVSTLLEVKE